SINLRNELARYKWKADRSGKTINEPVDQWNHLIDPLRYIALNKLKISNLALPKTKFPFKEERRHELLSSLITV
ncbi:MAG TPA: hypothetical protein VFE54_03335, partial [Mucilaginibacter sp.]|nr:hypothetical protein [Mucilaginibacter sp.]